MAGNSGRSKSTDSVDIQTMLETCMTRVGETIELFSANRTVSDCCRRESSLKLFEYVNSNGFWRNAYAAFQIATFINIAALVDNRADCSTLQTVAGRIEEDRPGSVPIEVFNDLASIQKRYQRFRHKVFAHTDHQRAALADEFDATGFSWESIEEDINRLERIGHILCAVHSGQPLHATDGKAYQLNIYRLRATKIAADTKELFRLIEGSQ